MPLLIDYMLAKNNEAKRPNEATKPTTAPPSSNASGIIVEETIAKIPPAAKAEMIETK